MHRSLKKAGLIWLFLGKLGNVKIETVDMNAF